MIETDDSIIKHEERFGDLKHIFHWSGCPGFEVAHTVISHIANCATREWREIESRYDSLAISGKLFFENRKWIGFGSMTGTCLEHIPRVLRSQPRAAFPGLGIGEQPAPTKLYLPIVSVVAALSNRKDRFDLDLPLLVNTLWLLSSASPRRYFHIS